MKRQVIILIGPVGCGKRTLGDLLMGGPFHIPQRQVIELRHVVDFDDFSTERRKVLAEMPKVILLVEDFEEDLIADSTIRGFLEGADVFIWSIQNRPELHRVNPTLIP